MILPELPESFNIDGMLLANEPMWRHTTFAVGGSADLYAVPDHQEDLRVLLDAAQKNEWDVFIIGGGSNLLIADGGLRGLVIDMRGPSNTNPHNIFKVAGATGRRQSPERGVQAVFDAGVAISDAAWRSGSQGLAGLEHFFAMPGTLGGAVWMNARCYGSQISSCFAWADVMKADGSIERVDYDANAWDYKISPFQQSDLIILRAAFNLSTDDDPANLRYVMLDHRRDRMDKGHFRKPCAGSAFKNDRSFGAPSGVLIDRCGLKGLSMGGAAVSNWHGNIIINTGGACANDIRRLLMNVRERVHKALGYRMELEIQIAGDWDNA